MSRVLYEEVERERRARDAAERKARLAHERELQEFKAMMREQMDAFKESMSEANANNQRLQEELSAEKARSLAQAERLEQEAYEREKRLRSEIGEAERSAAFRRKVEFDARTKEDYAEREPSRGRSAGLFDGIGHAGSSSSRGIGEGICGAVGRPPSGVREVTAEEEKNPLRNYRLPAKESDEEVRREDTEFGKRYLDTYDEEKEEADEAERRRDPLTRLADLLEGRNKRKGGEGEDLLHYGEDDSGDGDVKFKGSRGLAAFQTCEARWNKNPGRALVEVDASAKSICGYRKGGTWRLSGVLKHSPFQSFNIKKRSFVVLAEIGEALLQNQTPLAKGLVAQGLQWLALSLSLNGEDSAWRIMLGVSDPVSTPTAPPPRRPDLQRCGLQDVHQVTALVSIIKDEVALGKSLEGAGRNRYRKSKKGEKGDGPG